MTPHESLRRIAEAATPGERLQMSGSYIAFDYGETPQVFRAMTDADKRQILAFSPVECLRLLDRIDALEKVLAEGWQHRCSDGIGGCYAVSESAKDEVLSPGAIPAPSGGTMSRPSNYAMEKAAEEIGPDVLIHLNQTQLATKIDRAMAPVLSTLLGELRRIDADKRFHYKCANIVVNATLALIQLEMETRVRLAQRMLDVVGYKGPELDIRPGPQAVAEPPHA